MLVYSYLKQRRIWVDKATFDRNFFSHFKQTNCSPMPCFSLTWILRLSDLLNVWSHKWQRHITGLAVWHNFWWRDKLPAWLNSLPHCWQGNLPPTVLLRETLLVMPHIYLLRRVHSLYLKPVHKGKWNHHTTFLTYKISNKMDSEF